MSAAVQPIVLHRMYTRRSLVISTAHIPQATDQALRDDDPEQKELSDTALGLHLAYDAVFCGWNIFVSQEQIDRAKECEHPELAALIELALFAGFDYLVLDADAATLPKELGKPTFEW